MRQHGKLTDDQRKPLEGRFPITTLDRLLSTPAVRAKIGFDIKDNELLTTLPADEAIKPLRRLVLDLAEKAVNVTKLKLKTQHLEAEVKYLQVVLANLAKNGLIDAQLPLSA